ncbi:MAG: HAD-IA family hydrolase [Pseudanabaena sp.]|jgi:putative hydrolase of the HAD superfamily|nr:HAD-IA family hydrolase [Pseudanabaena sp. M090S1SP2A07QC]MCA6505839.1 HAD-IA family hydrolase [Pseudanabaena sp. M172S2SP2A07QC]MCA6521543.1 HAD-IA family hydrolase [Pseudanabaena sp. M051S1SP2A07QC]MCA6525316.1 HAD-IA family hydrolase [Pseudanabaena sp. M179S2SP2A07QC]MCA6528433.1 HAD-IA family hydrolase [Pseudanabaena sp. M125S2SP2A07QC]MCA6533716.1 HAD-IA family hydrolase [Pseudanabaena sp. M176S2SP2A07QC]MCA6539397.1 HAD-IA family hydrolase [Pseudanabaena sp. M037S2SP2A07QC]MCA654257
MRSPQVIYVDAVGTLFGVRGSVGEQYAKIATDFNVRLDPRLINRAFYEVFQTAPRIAFPNLPQSDIPKAEYEWWRSLAEETFSQTFDLAKFLDFEGFFKSLYAYFATSEPWFIYEDTRLALDAWQQQGITLGVLSNFDSRIYAVMENLGLKDYFSSVTISTETGAAKPDPLIFEVALAKHQIEKSPDLAWHIGDSFGEDYMGASAAGISAFWLNRDRQPSTNPAKQSARTIDKLTSLAIG